MSNPIGRPTKYNAEIAEEICTIVASTNKGIRKICEENPHFPSASTIYLWNFKHKEFSELYSRARMEQVELLLDEIIEISDDTSKETIVKQNKQGKEFRSCNSEWVNNKRLMVDSRFRLATLLKPKKYGTKISEEATDNLVKKLIDKL